MGRCRIHGAGIVYMMQEESRIRDHKGGRNYRCAAILCLLGAGCELGAFGVLAHLSMGHHTSEICLPARELTHDFSWSSVYDSSYTPCGL